MLLLSVVADQADLVRFFVGIVVAVDMSGAIDVNLDNFGLHPNYYIYKMTLPRCIICKRK